ncbi:MAG: transketolase [Coriobacteriales bacterium]|nr:transketolase [Coriobacteriales bacterium]
MHEDLAAVTRRMRAHIVTMLAEAGSGHPGGSLSATDIIATLYFSHMNVDPSNPSWEDRDRFVLGKGHAAPALYAALAIRGFFPEEDLPTVRKIDSHLQGHPCMNTTPGVDMSTGSLGQGLSVANGMALAGRIDHKDYYVYCVMGDGEIQEGQVWEAAMSAAHYGLDHLIAFVDHNGLQIDGANDNVMRVSPIGDKFRAFGWNVIELADGHDLDALDAAVTQAKQCVGAPTVIVCETTKGKGVSFMENEVDWHGVAPTKEQAQVALAEIEAQSAPGKE